MDRPDDHEASQDEKLAQAFDTPWYMALCGEHIDSDNVQATMHEGKWVDIWPVIDPSGIIKQVIEPAERDNFIGVAPLVVETERV